MKNRIAFTAVFLLGMLTATAQQRTVEKLDAGWKFHFGSASSVEKDFRNGTEYFNYLTKAHGIHNEGPYILKFDDADWQEVRIPHDWVVALPFAPEASHSHGYKTVGWKYPETSVGWYRKVLHIDKADEGKHIELQCDGIFRNSELWVNGFYMGGERSGYISHVYDISDYLEYGGDNVICVRADASLEEGWFYEGAGIYRDVWLRKTAPLHVNTYGTFIRLADADKATVAELKNEATMNITAEVANASLSNMTFTLRHTVLDASGKAVAVKEGCKVATVSGASATDNTLLPKQTLPLTTTVTIPHPTLWDIDTPYLYILKTEVISDGEVVDTYDTPFGIRTVEFSAERGFLLNGRELELKGVNCHQDHAGVGAAIPDGLQTWRLRQLKKMGCNAYRASHNPMTPALLDACDREGILVIDENRLMGVNDYQLHQLEQMIRRDRNHPSVIMWSDGNEEWGLENNTMGMKLAASMREYTHRLDPSRPVTIANAGGTELIKGLEVVGYNYIVQNDVEGRHRQHPEWKVVGTEETTACGTRGIYYPDAQGRWMPSINRTDSTYENIIERGWKFYHERPWAAGLFYWTGFDYRGEPNPLGFPAVGSQFGLLDYCGFPKDEAYYLKAWWTEENVLHIFPHWNLQGHEGETVDVWAYSNCEEVELFVNGKSAGRQQMPKDGHLKWQTVYQPGKLRAVGYRKGRKIMEQTVETTGEAVKTVAESETVGDVTVINVMLKDKKNRTVPTACNDVCLTIDGDGTILGAGNGDSAFKGKEQPTELTCKTFTMPAFNGMVQFIVKGNAGSYQTVIR